MRKGWRGKVVWRWKGWKRRCWWYLSSCSCPGWHCVWRRIVRREIWLWDLSRRSGGRKWGKWRFWRFSWRICGCSGRSYRLGGQRRIVWFSVLGFFHDTWSLNISWWFILSQTLILSPQIQSTKFDMLFKNRKIYYMIGSLKIIHC